MAQLLSAKPVLEALNQSTGERVRAFRARAGRPPKLSVLIVGENPASQVYVRRKGEAAVALGIESETIRLPATATPDQVRATITGLNEDPRVDGILIQRPLPASFVEEQVLYWVRPDKDVDAFHPENAGRLWLGLPGFQPCTPAGVMLLLKHYNVALAGRTAAIVGRSAIVGKPMASLLLQADATVLHAHSRTARLADITRQAEVLVVAVGRADLIRAEHVRPGAVVIDVGMNRNADGKLGGDVAFDEVAAVASMITPVPGGVGPMTIGVLLENTVLSAERRGK